MTVHPPIPGEELNVTRESEWQVIGALMAEPDTALAACEEVGLHKADFTRMGPLYALLQKRITDGLPVDLAAVCDTVRAARDPALGSVSDIEAVSQWATANPGYAARQIRECAQLRRLEKLGRWAVEQARKPIPDGLRGQFVSRALATAEASIVRLSNAGGGLEFRTPDHYVDDYLRDLEAYEATGAHPSTPTGLSALDRKLDGGLYPADLVVLAGRSAMGKTSAACSMVNALVEAEVGCGVLTIEMKGRDFLNKCASAHSGVRLGCFRSMRFDTGEARDRALRSLHYFRDARHLHVNEASKDWADIRGQIRALHLRMARTPTPLKVVFIDYLGLVDLDEEKGAPREQQLSKIVTGLKALAKSLGIAVVLLVQVNRAAEDGKSAVPEIRHLRGSGMIEQTADVILFGYRAAYYIPGIEEDEIQLHVAKGRFSGTGVLRFRWDGPSGLVSNWPDDTSPYVEARHRPHATPTGGAAAGGDPGWL